MACDAMVGARPTRVGMFAEAVAAISANCGSVGGRSVDLRVAAWTRHLMSIAIDVIVAIAGLLLRIGDTRDATQN